MAQIILRGNLSAVSFPLISEFAGRSIVIPQLDENYLPGSINRTTNDSDHDRGIPQISYCHNVVPAAQGYKSVAYNTIATGLVGHTDFFLTRVVKDASNNKAILGFTTAGGIYMLTSGVVGWQPLTVVGWTNQGQVTFAFVNGSTYICLQGLGVYLVAITVPGLTLQALTGLTASTLVGICDSNNYMIAYILGIVYWSSTSNPLDFVPSLITGAGSGTPNDLNGAIIVCAGLNNGFVIYNSGVPVIASYTGNSNYPWIFRSASFGAGITAQDQVTLGDGQGYHYAWTSAGIIRVEATGCEVVFPELTDFLAGKIFEDYDTATHTFTRTNLGSKLAVALTMIGSRYLVISYGQTDETYTHALVYDTAFSRWGKLRVNHVTCMEIAVNPVGGILNYTALLGTLYDAYTTTTYTQLSAVSNLAADPKNTMVFMQANGTLLIADFSFGNYAADAVIMLGKFEINRNQLCTLEQVEIEGIDVENQANVDVSVFSTIDGSTYIPAKIPTQTLSAGRLRKYNMRVTGTNHSICLHGSFHVTSAMFAFHNHGRR